MKFGLLDNRQSLHESRDPEVHAWEELVDRWSFHHQDTAVGVKELWNLLAPANLTPIDFDLGGGEPSRRRVSFGRRLATQRDKVIGGYQIVDAGKRSGAQLWRLMPLETVKV